MTDPGEEGAASRRWLAAGLAALAALGLGALFVVPAPALVGVLSRGGAPLLAAALTALAAVGSAHAVRLIARRLVGVPGALDRVDPARDLVVGLPLFGSLAFLVGHASAGPMAMAIVLAAPAGVGAFALVGWAKGRSAPTRAPLEPVTALAIGLVALAVFVAAAMALLPPANLDELAYHLAVPRQWTVDGRVVAYPLNSHSFFPFGVESASLPLLALLGARGAVASHLLHVIGAAAVLVVAHGFVRRRAGAAAAWVATAALATTPALLWTAGTTLTDWALLGACLVLLDALDEAAAPDAGPGPRLYVGLAIAAGVATKYTFGPFAIAALLAYVVAVEDRRAALRATGPWVAGGLVLGAAFLVRNAIATGNPLSPFGDAHTPHVAFFGDDATWAEVLARYVYHPEMVEESLGPALGVAALGLAVSWRRLAGRALPVAALGLTAALVGLAALRPVGRILVPYLAALALLAMIAAHHRRSDGPRRLHLGAVLVAAAAQAVLLLSLYAHFDPIARVATEESVQEYLRTERADYRTARWIDARLPDGSTTLVLGLQELYWFTHPVRGGGNFDGPRVAAYLDAESPDALAARVRGDGFTHVAVHRRHLAVGDAPSSSLAAERITTLTPAQAQRLTAFLDTHTVAVDSGEDTAVYRLLDATGSAR